MKGSQKKLAPINQAFKVKEKREFSILVNDS